ncbi:acyltransferase family protein [Kluyvera cryocrescens]|uniref:Acyltransferase family protein n=1 Tax=Kluyvera cryocrescens TaxID=580 RepID=A0AAW9CAC8_KLUCR|nr:acyltransferase family protein [Kluyvera cryocrescens]MDW3779161.1 acyltransferase family protein [Kluyvera cryocrescens]
MERLQYRKDIDGLRAIAVILVIIYHAFPSILTGGFIGVDIFFVISGYLITSIIHREIVNNKFSIIEFYRRRIDRIYPSLLVVLIASYIFGWFTLLPDEYAQHGKLMAASSVFMTNIALFRGAGYFDISSTLKPLLHLWSLGIEEQFYLVFPLALALICKYSNKIIPWVISGIAISFAMNLFIHSQDEAFYLPQYRLWELLAGSLISLTSTKIQFNKKLNSNLLSLLGLLFILLPALIFTPEKTFPGWLILFPIIGAMLVIIVGDTTFINAKILSSKPFVFIGLISYPLYLWHWPLLSFTFIIKGANQSPLALIFILFLSFLFAALTYSFIEKPLKKYKSRSFKTIPLFLMVLIMGCIGLFTYMKSGLTSRTSIEASYSANLQLVGPLWQYTQNKECMDQYKTKLSTTLPWWFCFLKRKGDPDIILLGNSYANHLYPAFAYNEHLKDLNVLSLGIYDPVAGMKEINDNNYHDDKFKNGKELAIYINKLINQSSNLKYIIIGGLDKDPNQEYVDLLIERISQVKRNNVKVVIFLPHLIMEGNVKLCIDRPLNKASNECITSLQQIDELRDKFEIIRSSVSKKFPDILFFDPNGIFCDNLKKICSPLKNGLPLYRDEYHHFSPYASFLVGEQFSGWAKYNLPDILK